MYVRIFEGFPLEGEASNTIKVIPASHFHPLGLFMKKIILLGIIWSSKFPARKIYPS